MYRTITTRSVALLALLLISMAIYGQNSKPKAPQFGKGISYMAKDSTFSTKFNLRIQSLYVATYDQTEENDDDAWSSQFLVRRFRLKWGGIALTPKLKYKVELGMSNRDISTSSEDGNTKGGARVILDAVLKWQFAKNWNLWVGQTKLPGNRERVISSGSLQFVDRSLVNSRFTLDRDAGIQLRGKLPIGQTAYIAPSLAITMGEGRNITSDNQGGYDYTVHVDILPFGKFAKKGDYFGADLAREQTPKLAFGLTFDYNDGAVRQGGQLKAFVRDSAGIYAENDLTSFMADMVFKYKGWSVTSTYINKSAAKDMEGLSKNFNTGSGFNIATGYLFNNNVELALRYTTIRNDGDFSGLKDENEITLGLSKYVLGHKLKVQTDIAHIAAPGESEGNIRFRAQVEMQF
jgi:phosphate-selective porin OprO/OprP